MAIFWILFGLIGWSQCDCASIPENGQVVGFIGYFTNPNELNRGINNGYLQLGSYNMFSDPILFYPIYQTNANQNYVPSEREAVEAEQNTGNTEVTDVTDKMDLVTVTPSSLADDIPPINSLPLDESPAAGLLKPPGAIVPPTIPLRPGPYGYGYGYASSNQNVHAITFTTSLPPLVYHPLSIPSRLYHEFRPSPQQTTNFNHFRPSYFAF